MTDRNEIKHRAKAVVFLFAACLLLTGCFCASRGDWREYRIFCGMSHSDGIVPDAEWEEFCDKYVTAEFPDGYTTMRATGYWKSEETSATIREDTRVIVVLAPSDAKEKVRRIAQQNLFRDGYGWTPVLPENEVFYEGDIGTEAESREPEKESKTGK